VRFGSLSQGTAHDLLVLVSGEFCGGLIVQDHARQHVLELWATCGRDFS
jgi:hypothetical protein